MQQKPRRRSIVKKVVKKDGAVLMGPCFLRHLKYAKRRAVCILLLKQQRRSIVKQGKNPDGAALTGWYSLPRLKYVKKGGVYFTTEAAAKKYCETVPESGWCCLDGMVFPATPEVCKKKGGMYFLTKAEALKYCDSAAELPDLEVVNIFLTKKCEVAVKVKNNGPGMVPDSVWTIHTPKSSSVYIYINGKSWGGATIWKFDPGKSLKAPGGTAVYVSTLIVKTEAKIVATIDHTLQVTEINEINNKMGKLVKCEFKMKRTNRLK